MREKIFLKDIKKLKESVYSVFNKIINSVLNEEMSFKQELLQMLLIRYGYLILTVVILDGLWYQGYGSYGIGFVWWKEALALVTFIFLFGIYKKYPVHGVFISSIRHLLFLVYILPLNCAISINKINFVFYVFSNIYIVLLLVATSWISSKLEKICSIQDNQEESKDAPNKLLGFLCVSICILYIIHKIDYNGLRFSIDLLGEDLYANRADYEAYLSTISGTAFSYILSIVRYLVVYIAPFMMFYGLLNKKMMYTSISIFTLVAMFSVSQEKNNLLLPLVVLVIYFLKKCKLELKFVNVVNKGMLILFLTCFLERIILRGSQIYYVLVRRIMYYPAWLNTLYFDFFSQNKKIMWTQNVILLQNIFEPVYEVPPLQLISNTYFQGTIPSPNTGLFAEAYMHWGIIGVLVYPFILSLLLVVSELVLRKYNIGIRLVVACQLILSITNVPITRTDFVLSYVLMILILMFVPYVEKLIIIKKNNRLLGGNHGQG